jgi:death on curing protein
MKEPEWLLEETLIALHEVLVSEFGGETGIRDEGLLESALARPRNLLNYGRADLFDLAAAYAYGLVKNHPFIDGNKRVGFMAGAIFLELNRIRFRAAEVDAAVEMLAVAAGERTEIQFAQWLRDHSD